MTWATTDVHHQVACTGSEAIQDPLEVVVSAFAVLLMRFDPDAQSILGTVLLVQVRWINRPLHHR